MAGIASQKPTFLIHLASTGNYPEGRAYALEVERSTDGTLQCVARFLMMVSFALEGDVTGSEKHFLRFIDLFTAQSDSQPCVPDWNYSGLIKAITKSGVAQQTKFVLLTLIDLQLGKLLRSSLTFFAAPPNKTAPNSHITSASVARV